MIARGLTLLLILLATTASAIDNDIEVLVVTAPGAVSGSIVRFWPLADYHFVDFLVI